MTLPQKENYAKICPKFTWIYGYENRRDPWVTVHCHWCLHLDESSLTTGKSIETIKHKCEIPEREFKKNAWNEAHIKGQVML